MDQTLAAWHECVRMGDAWDIEHRFRGVDGQWHPILARGVPVRNDRGEIIAWVGINLDISELKQVENELRESEARFRNVADTAPVLIWMSGVGGCQFVNKVYLDYTGCPVEQLLGMGWADFLHPQDAEGYVEKFLAAFDAKQPFEAQVRMRRADGQFRWFSTTSTPRFRADGEFLGFIGCSVDVTEMKASEAALREADRRKDDFLAMLGHELRNPLAGIVTGAQVLSMLDLDKEAGEMQAVIARQATYMSRIVDDLLDVSRIARGKLRLRHQHANLRDLLRNAVEDYSKAHALEDCKLQIDVPEEDAWVWADPARLTQAFSNVIHNGCKFSDGPNVVTVAMTIDREAHQATVVISDRGIGMSPETVARIFQPFIQADTSLERSRGGLGLGLALGRGLIHLHGGSVTAASPGLGKGSSFTITLPLVAPPARQDSRVQQPASDACRVLIIDDRRDAILPLRKMLEMDGHRVEAAENGPAGLERAAQFRPDIVMCDIGLVGDMDGYGVSRAMRGDPQLAGVYLVAVTGYGHEEARRMAKEAGFDFHVTKPVSMQQVRHVVSRRPSF
jgi:PAS domain S-box-containing protein